MTNCHLAGHHQQQQQPPQRQSRFYAHRVVCVCCCTCVFSTIACVCVVRVKSIRVQYAHAAVHDAYVHFYTIPYVYMYKLLMCSSVRMYSNVCSKPKPNRWCSGGWALCAVGCEWKLRLFEYAAALKHATHLRVCHAEPQERSNNK